MTLIADRLEEAQAKLVTLRRQRAGTILEGILEGKVFEGDGEIIQLSEHVRGLEEAEGERVRRERAAAAAEEAEVRARAFAELLDKEQARLALVAKLEMVTRDFVQTLVDIQDVSMAMRTVASRMEKSWVAAPVDDTAQSVRLSLLMTAILKTIPGHLSRFGNIEWNAGYRNPDDNWATLEAGAMADNLQRLKDQI